MKSTLKNIQAQLQSITYQFLLEQADERQPPPISSQASLERQMGIDSLGKVELFRRIEKAFEVHLPDQVMAEADTLDSIAKAVLNAAPKKTFKSNPIQEPLLEQVIMDRSNLHTLPEVLFQYASETPQRPHIYLRDEDTHETLIHYGDLFENACRIANSIRQSNIHPGETIAIMLPTSSHFFYAFFGVLFAQAVPVPIYPPFRADRIEEYAKRETHILNNAQARMLITFSQAKLLSKVLQAEVPSLKQVVTAESLLSNTSTPPEIPHDAEQLALLQYTSGSTGDPKGILLQHKNILANMQGIQQAIKLDPTDRVVSWLPLYHDMGLMSWLNCLYFGIPLTLLSPLTFLNHPEQWLWAIHDHRATLSAGPNFAYELCVKKIDETSIRGLDLSSWRLAFNGAEPVNAQTLKRFYQKFKRYGLKPEALYPVYGLAENTVGLTFPELNREPRIDRIAREPFEKKQQAIPSRQGDRLEWVSVGKCIAHHHIRIADDNNQALPERHIGNIQFQGPSAMQGYHHRPDVTQAVYHHGWWDTGDLGYLADGELFITGRKKDLIIKSGRNLYPESIEGVVGSSPGIRKGCVIAFGTVDPNLGTEKMIIVAETKLTDIADQKKLESILIEKISIAIGVPPDQVILVPPHTIPKTSSGKLQRSACKQAYLKGELKKKPKTLPWQMIFLILNALGHHTARFVFLVGRVFYSLYTWMMLFITVIPVWLVSLSIPTSLAARLIKSWAKLLFRLVFCPIKVINLCEEQLKPPVIYVANHASYVDSLALLSILPPGTLVAGKKELLKLPIISSIMKKLNFIPIDRWNFLQNLEDMQQMKSYLKQKKSLLIFPEGTFSYPQALRPFKTGAFQLAVDTQTPICPITIRNSKKFLPSQSILFSPKTLTLTRCKLLHPKGKHWNSVIKLRQETRQVITKYSEETVIPR